MQLIQLSLEHVIYGTKISVLFTDHKDVTHFLFSTLISSIQQQHTNNNEGHSIEPGAQIRQTPEQYSKLDRVYQILNQEQSSQFQSCCIHVGHGDVCHFPHLILWQCQVQFQDVPDVNKSIHSEHSDNLYSLKFIYGTFKHKNSLLITR